MNRRPNLSLLRQQLDRELPVDRNPGSPSIVPDPIYRVASDPMMGSGSAGETVAAALSIMVPGAGQLCQGRIKPALGFFFCSLILWSIIGVLGFLTHLAACVEAALHRANR